MKFLFDTSVLIPAEPTSASDVEALTEPMSRLIGLLEGGGHQIFVHPLSLGEIGGDTDTARRRLRKTLLAKYLVLDPPPVISDSLRTNLGEVPENSHDVVDEALLAAVEAEAVSFLVTADYGILRKGRRAGLESRVVTPADAFAAAESLFLDVPVPPPAVEHTPCYTLDPTDPFFDSLRDDYDDFDAWFRKCRQEHRNAWVIREGGRIAGLCITKDRIGTGQSRSLLKLCTFKVAEAYRGLRYGELLLKAVFGYAFSNGLSSIYLTVFPKHEGLISLFEHFGFEKLDAQTGRGESVMEKRLQFTQSEYDELDPLDFHIRFGPKHVKAQGAGTFVVPILPRYHIRLFPDLERQAELYPGRSPFGNALRKAYLCHAPTRRVQPGSILLFYRSADARCLTAIGVAEQIRSSIDPEEIAGFVGTRTVFSFAEIERMCDRSVLAILFRMAGVLAKPISIHDLVAGRLLSAVPRSITQLKNGGNDWLRHQIEGLL